MKWHLTALLLLVASPALLPAAPPALELRKGDHVCLVGNTLPDRMQHFGWLETYLYARYPQHDLVVRNLGYSGDELTLRLRSASFGSPDEWLTKTQAELTSAGGDQVATTMFERGLAFEENVEWLPQLGISYHLGIDGMNAPMVLLTGLVAVAGVLISWRIDDRTREFMVFFMLRFLRKEA